MKPLPIGKMQIEVYNVEESPLHQIVKKLIYKKILDLEPYNFNHVSDSTGDLAKKIYGRYADPGYQERELVSYTERDAKQKEIRETMKWGDITTNTILEYIHNTLDVRDEQYDPNPFERGSRRATTYIPLRSYKDKVRMEHAFFLDGLRIVPDITLLDEKGKAATVIEILHTSIPKADKLIKLIESDLNVIFVLADQAIEELSADMTCRRASFGFPIREAWLGFTNKKEKISRAVNILLQKKMYRDKEYITHKDVITNTEWNPKNKWRKNRMDVGLRITTKYPLGRELIQDNHNLSHSMIQMKETSDLIILLRYLKKYTKEEKTKNESRMRQGQRAI